MTNIIVAFFLFCNSANTPNNIISLTLYIGAEFSIIFIFTEEDTRQLSFKKFFLVMSQHNRSEW